MKNRIKVEIAGDLYTIVADEDETYVRKTAALVDEKMTEILTSSSLSTLAAAVLTAVNLADDYQKTIDAADNMRAQMKSYLEDAARLRNELNEARRELNKLKNSR